LRVPYQDCFHLIEPLLAKVEKPSRYIDHEWGTLSKADADYRCCLIYPDVYEVGLPNQGIAILYNILNQAEGISCERGYVPWPDMGDAMREAGIRCCRSKVLPPSLRLISSACMCRTRWR